MPLHVSAIDGSELREVFDPSSGIAWGAHVARDAGWVVAAVGLTFGAADTNVDVAPGVPELCDGVNNDCTNPAWPDPTGIDTDDDGDGLSECELDCNDADGNSFDIPGEPLIVEAARGPDTTVNFVWDPPQSPGGDPASLRYDVLRSSDASDFLCDATCVEFDDDKDLQASDDEIPASNTAFFYLVRAGNGCPHNLGNVGTTSWGKFRFGRECP